MERIELEPAYENGKGFYGRAWVVKIDPGIEILESFGRPTALWLESTGQVYLLRGWNVTLTSVSHVRHFASPRTGIAMPDYKHLRKALRRGTDVIDCAASGALSQDALDALVLLLDLYQSDKLRPFQLASRIPLNPSDGARQPRSYEPISILLHEWLEETGGITIGRTANVRLFNIQVNQLLVDAGYLKQDKSPTEKGEDIGIIFARGNAGQENEYVYALYPRKRFPEYRKLIADLYSRHVGETTILPVRAHSESSVEEEPCAQELTASVAGGDAQPQVIEEPKEAAQAPALSASGRESSHEPL